MKKNNSDIKIRFGKYKGRLLKDIPDDYLEWCLSKNILKGKARAYARKKLNHPKDTFRIEVEDAVVGDGVYFVKAYSQKEALYKVKRENKIKITQSYSGTSFSITIESPKQCST